jgi:hypothetical protein
LVEFFNLILDLKLSKEEKTDFRLFTPSLLFPAAKEVSKGIQVHVANRSNLTTVKRLEELIHGKRLGHRLLWRLPLQDAGLTDFKPLQSHL